ncbi:MAG: beta-3-deoxy-D-manno-oct-2-ulosonic acid transferase [Rhizobacter sp.]|nr:beta-3-deoxy-D-manno-oct-2-ulosonic acid transferase [Rhizobacter sp.]
MWPQPEPLRRLGPPPQRLFAVGFTPWKRKYLRLCFPRSELVYIDDPGQVPATGAVVAWGTRVDAAALRPGVSLLRVEDGFLRSVGLGADLVRPLSWVIDRRGLHFDPRRPSDLEVLLSQTVPGALSVEAARLRDDIVTARLTKYNVGAARWQRPRGAKKVVLVPGQVESDASLRLGAPGIRCNMTLLQAVRVAEPDAYIVYKTHPDVAARLRAAGAGESLARTWCDEVVADVPMADLLEAADELHVMTSLAGFEALLRGKRVVCHGQPFYAGWGLTHDLHPLPRRVRRLTLAELVAAALIRYPFYFSRDGRRLSSPREAVHELIRWREETGGPVPWWRHAQRTMLRRAVGVR